MVTFTLEEAVANHRKLWNAIVEYLDGWEVVPYSDGIKIKEEVLADTFPQYTGISSGCFLCQFTKTKQTGPVFDCYLCPMMKEGMKICLDGRNSDFDVACMDDDIEKAIKLAREIADLPVANPLYLRKEEENDQ